MRQETELCDDLIPKVTGAIDLLYDNELREEMSTVLVIGGGVGGCSAIVGLRKFDKGKTDIILVDPKDHCEIFWAAYRSPFEDWVAKDSLASLGAWSKKHKVKHVRSYVVKLTRREATLQNGEVIAFDVCVVATGAADKSAMMGRGLPSGDGTRESRLKEMKEAGDRIMNSNSVAIVGGGFIGCELAGDISAYSKQRNQPVSVTLVHSGASLCHHEISQKASKMVQKKLEKLGVKVILNDKADKKPNGTVVLKHSGDTLVADEVIYTTGLLPVNGFLEECFEASLNQQGWIETDDCFRMKGEANMFCIGDCSTLLANAGNKYLNNMKVIGKNLIVTLDAIANGCMPPKEARLVKAKEGLDVAVVTVGNKEGVAWTPVGHSQFLLPSLKNKTMFFHAKGQLEFPKER
ncbi:Apoptosis-inducing factor homolog [Seminavis robusta]|uniref:Apoptosis-inducing factor homolog n=1 Tax=Seminavis robusta TaxID=568900 RepID=A0A9N8EKX0_9STRA|nr:Apoptosis-inducing factor homolog [Seminavis robusta]|eukprot:Sro1442_g273020.1 Apoptosis-inducing factor homolog (406) ;mRNA; f:4636-6026